MTNYDLIIGKPIPLAIKPRCCYKLTVTSMSGDAFAYDTNHILFYDDEVCSDEDASLQDFLHVLHTFNDSKSQYEICMDYRSCTDFISALNLSDRKIEQIFESGLFVPDITSDGDLLALPTKVVVTYFNNVNAEFVIKVFVGTKRIF